MQAQFPPGLPMGDRALLGDALVEAINVRLIAEFGSTMSLADIAMELGITAVALRVRQSRYGDLPVPIPHLRTLRWPTPRIAAWLCSLGADRADTTIPDAAMGGFRRRRGRRRLPGGSSLSGRAPDGTSRGQIDGEGAP